MNYMDMESVFVQGIKADRTMEIVRELRTLGLKQGIDFEFRYQKDTYINGSWSEGVELGGAEFYFRQGKWCSYVALKYGK